MPILYLEQGFQAREEQTATAAQETLPSGQEGDGAAANPIDAKEPISESTEDIQGQDPKGPADCRSHIPLVEQGMACRNQSRQPAENQPKGMVENPSTLTLGLSRGIPWLAVKRQ